MSWTKETGKNGLPAWRGTDSIANTTSGGASEAWFGIGLCLLLGVAGLAMILHGGPHGIGVVIGGLIVPMGGFGIWALVAARKEGGYYSAKWFNPHWLLAADGGELLYKNLGDGPIAGERWRLPVDAVARVETGRTSDYIPSRKIGASILSTSPHEWQVFLFLNDGTRRQVYVANAARDDCAALAASIRGYVENARATSAPVHHVPAAQGFDL